MEVFKHLWICFFGSSDLLYSKCLHPVKEALDKCLLRNEMKNFLCSVVHLDLGLQPDQGDVAVVSL